VGRGGEVMEIFPDGQLPVKGALIKKENKIFLIYKEIQMGSGAKSYMRKGLLIYEEMHKHFLHI
jgi:hypothetical protein